MSGAAMEIARVTAVVALLAAAAAFATPKGRVPLALRGVMRVLGREGALPQAGGMAAGEAVSPARRLVAFVLVLLAVSVAAFAP